MIVNEVIQQIDAGRKGDNWGLPMGLPKLEYYIDGVSRSTYTLLFSGSGVGKTSLALYSYIYRPLMDNLDNDNFRIIYYSLEMSRSILFLKLLTMYIQEKYGIEISTKEILSKRRGETLSDEHYKIILECRGWLEKVESKMNVYDRSLNAILLKNHLNKDMEKNGTFVKTDTTISYDAKNKKQVVLVVIDHMSLLRTSEGRSLKQEIDLASSFLVTYRNICGISPLVIMQTNRESSSMDRRNGGFQEPQRSDIKDSGAPEQDAEVILSIYDPIRDKLGTHRKYDVKQMEKHYRSIILLKNRYDSGDIAIGCAFYGKCGIWKELPRAEDIYDYTMYNTINGQAQNSTSDGEICTDLKKEKLIIEF